MVSCGKALLWMGHWSVLLKSDDLLFGGRLFDGVDFAFDFFGSTLSGLINSREEGEDNSFPKNYM